MTDDWVLKKFCLVVVLFFTRSNQRARGAYSGRLTSGKGYPALARCVRPVIRSYLQ